MRRRTYCERVTSFAAVLSVWLGALCVIVFVEPRLKAGQCDEQRGAADREGRDEYDVAHDEVVRLDRSTAKKHDQQNNEQDEDECADSDVHVALVPVNGRDDARLNTNHRRFGRHGRGNC